MSDDEFLNQVLAEMRRGFPHGIERHGNVFSTGLTMSSGRSVGVIVEHTLSSLRVSDGGDAWSDLVLEGYADPRPTQTERERLERACELHGVHWDERRREVFAIANELRELPRCAAQVAATALAIDGWRAWYPPRRARNVYRRQLVEHVSRLAPIRGWHVEVQRTILHGKVHTWSADAMLARGDRQAAVEITAERSGDHVMQRIVGFLYDVQNAGLVVVVPRTVQQYIEGSAELRERVAVVPKLPKGTPRAIVEAAERAAA